MATVAKDTFPDKISPQIKGRFRKSWFKTILSKYVYFSTSHQHASIPTL